jgi:GNAT superfamily N-acetyltransferase
MSLPKLSLVPMEPERVPAYFRSLADWYAEALREHGCGSAEGLHASSSRYFTLYTESSRPPSDSTVFDILVEGEPGAVGALWCGGTDFGSGPVQFVHDLRIFPPFRRRGYARRTLDALAYFARREGGVQGVALSVLVRNAPALRLYEAEGFVPLSQVMVRSLQEERSAVGAQERHG